MARNRVWTENIMSGIFVAQQYPDPPRSKRIILISCIIEQTWMQLKETKLKKKASVENTWAIKFFMNAKF